MSKDDNYENIDIWLSEDVLNELKLEASKIGITYQELITDILNSYVNGTLKNRFD